MFINRKSNVSYLKCVAFFSFIRLNNSHISSKVTYRELLLGYKEITIPFLTNNTDSSNYIFVIFVKNPILKEKMITDLRNEKIQTSFHYTPLHKFSYYKSKNLLPIVEEVSKGLVTLPLHNRLSINDVKRVCTIISKSIQEWREQ